MAPYTLPTTHDVDRAARLISHKVIQTPVKVSPCLDRIATSNLLNHTDKSKPQRIKLFLKCENLQKTGSFKFRGASHFLTKLQDKELAKGIVAYSTGNHAQAVAHAAQVASRERGVPIPAYVVVPSNCPSKKVDATKAYGATVSLAGAAPEDRVALAKQIREVTGAILVPPADHVDIVLGQATAVQELVQQVADMGEQLNAVVVPSGGGGLLVGTIAVCKPQGMAIFAAEPESGGPGLAAAIRNGRRSLELHGSPSIADGLRSLTGQANWEHIQQPGNVDEVCTVSEEEIKDALRLAVEELGYWFEPSAAVSLATALFSPALAQRLKKYGPNVKVGVVLSGGNISGTELQYVLPGPERSCYQA